MTTTKSLEDLSNLGNGEWILLVKNSLFWKAKIELERLQADTEENYLLQIGYGKNKALSLHSDPSQVLKYPTREKAVSNLAKLFRDKIRNGYEASTFELCDLQSSKEAMQSTQKKPKDADKDQLAGFDPEVNSHIEHKCQKIPTVLTFNFGDSDAEASGVEPHDASAEEEQQDEEEEDFTLGKRNIGELHNDAPADSEADKQPPRNSDHLMSIRDMLDQKMHFPADPKAVPQTLKRPPDSFLSNTPKREAEAKKASKENSLAKVATTSHSRFAPNSQSKELPHRPAGVSLSNSSHKQASAVDAEEQAARLNKKWNPFPTAAQMAQVARDFLHPTEEEAATVNWVFKRKIHGSNLYEVTHHTKTFTESLTLQTKDHYLHLQYEVNEDMTLSCRELHQFANALQPVKAAAEIAQRLKEHGFNCETEELSSGLGYGTINSLKSRNLNFKDHSNPPAPHLEAASEAQTPLPSAQKSNPAKTQQASEHKSPFEESQTNAEQQQLEAREEPESEEPVPVVESEEEEEAEEQGENLKYECLSHSRASLLQESLEVQSITPLRDLFEESLVKRSKLRQHWNSADGHKRSSVSVCPLGPASEGMIPLMLLHNYKQSLDINSKPRSQRLALVREGRRRSLLLVRY